MALKSAAPTGDQLSNSNRETLNKNLISNKGDSPELNMLRVIAELLDMIANGEDIYMVLGATRRKDSFTVTLKHNGIPTILYSATLVGLSDEVATLL